MFFYSFNLIEYCKNNDTQINLDHTKHTFHVFHVVKCQVITYISTRKVDTRLFSLKMN